MPIILPINKTDNINKQEKSKNALKAFLEKKKVTTKKLSTHTSWGWMVGKYHLDYDSEKELLKLYSSVVENGLPGDMPLTLTQKPKEYSPIYVDIDLKLNKSKHSGDSNIYDDKLLLLLVKYYFYAIEKYFDLEDNEKICCIFEKEGIEDKHPHVGSGIHLLFPYIIASPKIRYLIRENVIKQCEISKVLDKYDNPISDIIDISVVDRNNIMMYGSKKPESKYYYNYTKCIEYVDNNFNSIDVDDIFETEKPSVLDYLKIFSLRRKSHIKENQCVLSKDYNDDLIDMEFKLLGISSDTTQDYTNMTVIEGNEESVEEARTLIGMLSAERATSYDSWIKVGWALYNIDVSLYPDFVDFSRRADEVKPGSFKGEFDVRSHWSKMKKRDLGMGSLKMWAKLDSPIEYEQYRTQKVKDYLMKSIDQGDYVVAKAFYEKYQDRFICSSVSKNKIWWEYVPHNHRWVEIQAGFSILKLMSEGFSNDYAQLMIETSQKFMTTQGNEKNEHKRQTDMINKLINKLNQDSYRNSVLNSLAILYYDPQFMGKLDEQNKHLIGFENGVYDLDKEEFRAGRPDDYISKSTGWNYIPHSPRTREFLELKDYFEKVLPIENVRKYFLRALSSCLHGDNKDQKLFICTGSGSNAKSNTFKLVDEAFGDYFDAPRIELLTRKSNNAGQANEDLVDIKGKRCGVFQEPDNDETFNASVMKQLTAGNDKIKARKLHQSNITFIPQMKYFLACNDLPNVKDSSDGTWRRLRVIPFIAKFLNKPLDKCRADKYEFPIDDTIPKKQKDWAPYFLSYLVYIYLTEYKKVGLQEPKEVLMKTKSYKSENDYYTRFYDEIIEELDISDPNYKKSKIKFTVLFDRFKNWYIQEVSKNFVIKKTKLQEYFNDRLDQKVLTTGSFIGIRFKEVETDDDDEEVNEKTLSLNV
jgi:P4 family phage/plasmid primase-like protien